MLHVATPLSAEPIPTSVSIPTLIAAERAARDRFERAVIASDHIALGRPATVAENAEREAADQGQTVALCAVLSATPRCPADLIAQMDLFDERHGEYIDDPYAGDLSNLFASARAYLDPVRYFGVVTPAQEDAELLALGDEFDRNRIVADELASTKPEALEEEAAYNQDWSLRARINALPALTSSGLAAKARATLAAYAWDPEADCDVSGSFVELAKSLATDAQRISTPPAVRDEAGRLFDEWIATRVALSAPMTDEESSDDEDSLCSRLCRQQWGLEDRIAALPFSPVALAAMALTESLFIWCDPEGEVDVVGRGDSDERLALGILRAVRPHLTGTLAAMAGDLLDNPGRPIGESLLWLSDERTRVPAQDRLLQAAE